MKANKNQGNAPVDSGVDLARGSRQAIPSQPKIADEYTLGLTGQSQRSTTVRAK